MVGDDAERARKRFDDAFEALQARSKSAADARPQRDLEEISAEHVKLDELRREAWHAKKGIVSRREHATPEWVEIAPGHHETSRRSHVFAIIGALLVASVVPIMWFGLLRANLDLDMQIDSQRIVQLETDDGRNRCLLDIRVGVTNGDSSSFEMTRATAVIDRRRAGVTIAEDPLVVAGTGRVFTLQVVVAPVSSRPCPGLGEVDRGTLTVDFQSTDDTTVEVRRTAQL